MGVSSSCGPMNVVLTARLAGKVGIGVEVDVEGVSVSRFGVALQLVINKKIRAITEILNLYGNRRQNIFISPAARLVAAQLVMIRMA